MSDNKYNPDNKDIRFIDSNYNELFRIPDGGYISVTRSDMGEEYIYSCKYHGETHIDVGGNCYHICQFAEIQERNKSIVKPIEKPQIINGYLLYEKVFVGETVFAAGINAEAPLNKQCVTWQIQNDRVKRGQTRYFPDKSKAWGDLLRRADGERRGIPYRPKELEDTGAR